MHFDFLATFGIVGSIASIVGILLPGSGWRAKVIHVAYGLAITILAAGVLYYRTQLNETRQIEFEAKRLVATADLSSDGKQRGFILASIGFLEKYRTRMPVTFDLALKLSESVGVTVSKQDNGLERLHQTWRLGDGAEAMKQLLAGVAGGGVD